VSTRCGRGSAGRSIGWRNVTNPRGGGWGPTLLMSRTKRFVADSDALPNAIGGAIPVSWVGFTAGKPRSASRMAEDVECPARIYSRRSDTRASNEAGITPRTRAPRRGRRKPVSGKAESAPSRSFRARGDTRCVIRASPAPQTFSFQETRQP